MSQNFAFIVKLRNTVLKDLVKNYCLNTWKQWNVKMVQGAFLYSKMNELNWCDKFINTKEYITINEKGLLPTTQKLFSLINWADTFFQHDSTPPHSANWQKSGFLKTY